MEPFPTDEDPRIETFWEPFVLLLMLRISSITPAIHRSNAAMSLYSFKRDGVVLYKCLRGTCTLPLIYYSDTL